KPGAHDQIIILHLCILLSSLLLPVYRILPAGASRAGRSRIISAFGEACIAAGTWPYSLPAGIPVPPLLPGRAAASGPPGGMEFQALRYVLFTHSRLSSLSLKILWAI